jgi:4-alpha-glucanotransferase
MNIDEKIKKLGLARSYLNDNKKIEEISSDHLHALAELLYSSKSLNDHKILEDSYVVVQGDELVIIPNVVSNDVIQYKLVLENGEVLNLTSDNGKIALPKNMPFGYHQIKEGEVDQQNCSQLIYAPKKCYMPNDLQTNKIWGCTLQLYTLRSDSNWGMGNLTDLQQFAIKGADQGMNVLGLNPMHLLYNEDGRNYSPYSPSSRILLDPKYIDWQKLPEAEQAMRKFQAENDDVINDLRASDLINYQGYSQLIFSAAKISYAQFLENADTNRMSEFNQYIADSSESHKLICLFQAIYSHFYQKNNENYSWQQWPLEFQDYQSQAVQDFSIEQCEQIRFHQFMQWVANEQLAMVQKTTKERGMSLGLYRDLAVGVDNHGAETWMYSDIYNCSVSVGAPPDALALQGQNWSLPVMNPAALKARGYEPFVQMIRANMAHAGALRIDHIMGLFRIWCMPAGKTASSGTYIHYPLTELMAILALESQRHECMVIGENLGVVPDEISLAMNAADIYSYKVFLFERENEEQDLKSPQHYEKNALATLSTHDLPTMAGFWQSIDLDILQRLKLFPSESDRKRLIEQRHSFQKAFIRAMTYQTDISKAQDLMINDLQVTTVIELAHEYLASSKANITVFQPDDFLTILQPINLPGTTDQYPNWRRKLTHSVEDFFADERRISHMKSIDYYRTKAAFKY